MKRIVFAFIIGALIASVPYLYDILETCAGVAGIVVFGGGAQ